MNTPELIALILPLAAIQLTLMVIALRDLLQPDRQVAGGSKAVWGVVIVLSTTVAAPRRLAITSSTS